MKAYQANLINGLVLVSIGMWSCLESGIFLGEAESKSVLLPIAFGLPLLLSNYWLKKDNKIIAHIVVLLTFVIFLGLFMPLMAEIGRGDTMGVLRVSIMLVSSFFAIVMFIKSFIEARKKNLK